MLPFNDWSLVTRISNKVAHETRDQHRRIIVSMIHHDDDDDEDTSSETPDDDAAAASLTHSRAMVQGNE